MKHNWKSIALCFLLTVLLLNGCAKQPSEEPGITEPTSITQTTQPSTRTEGDLEEGELPALTVPEQTEPTTGATEPTTLPAEPEPTEGPKPTEASQPAQTTKPPAVTESTQTPTTTEPPMVTEPVKPTQPETIPPETVPTTEPTEPPRLDEDELPPVPVF